MSVTVVVDASAVAAVLFDEPEAEPVIASIADLLTAPNLLLYELANICAAKIARRPGDAHAVLARYALFAQLDIELVEPDWAGLPTLALDWTVSAYDAAYLQLALARGAPLVTLDAHLAAVYDKASA